MPMKTVSKPASVMDLVSFSSSARLMETWVVKGVGPLFFFQSMRAGWRSFFWAGRLPIRLSSTKKTSPFQPAALRESSSAMIWVAFLVRGSRPRSAVTLQNSQS